MEEKKKNEARRGEAPKQIKAKCAGRKISANGILAMKEKTVLRANSPPAPPKSQKKQH